MVEFVEYTDDLVEQLNNEDLKDFLYSYNRYVQNFYDEHDEGSYPVSMTEFYNNDFQEM